jgi:hypothetical protein
LQRVSVVVLCLIHSLELVSRFEISHSNRDFFVFCWLVVCVCVFLLFFFPCIFKYRISVEDTLVSHNQNGCKIKKDEFLQIFFCLFSFNMKVHHSYQPISCHCSQQSSVISRWHSVICILANFPQLLTVICVQVISSLYQHTLYKEEKKNHSNCTTLK